MQILHTGAPRLFRSSIDNKKAYDPRSYLTLAETAMAERVKQAVKELRAVGTTMLK